MEIPDTIIDSEGYKREILHLKTDIIGGEVRRADTEGRGGVCGASGTSHVFLCDLGDISTSSLQGDVFHGLGNHHPFAACTHIISQNANLR